MPRFFIRISAPALLAVFFAVIGFAHPSLSASGGRIEITPPIIDENAQASGLFEYTVNIKNGSDLRFELYALVRDIQVPDSASTTRQSDRSASLASWVSFFRGSIILTAGEEKTFPLKIKISPDALVGTYYSEIAFGNGANITEAEASVRNENFPKLLPRFNVAKKSVELAQIISLAPGKSIFFSMPVSFLFDVANNGTTIIKPRGSLTIFDRRGKEISSVPVRETEINAGEKESYRVSLESFSKFGKFKAKTTLEYGDALIRNMEDVTEFWVLPWSYMLIFIGCAFLLLFLFIYAFSRRNKKINKASVEPKLLKTKVLNLKDKG
jgi:hypothetical protein